MKNLKAKIFLTLAFAVFVFVSGRFLLDGWGETWNSVTADDHYAWILKAPQLSECPQADCRFIKDTKAQMYLDFNQFSYELNLKRWREQHCLFDIYTPLYTVHMWLYKKLFGLENWEMAYQYVALTGFLVSTLGLLAFLVTVFGYYPAGIALLFMSVSKWGWLYFGITTPSFFITGLMFTIWTLYLKRPHLFLKLLPCIIVIISLYHSIGKIYSVGLLLVALFFFFEEITSQLQKAALYLLSVLSFVFVMALGMVEQPQFKLIKFPFDNAAEIIQHFFKNIEAQMRLYPQFFYIRLDWISAGLICFALILGLIRLVQKTNKAHPQQSLIGLLFLFLSGLSVFHLFKNYPGELSARLFIPLFAFVCGAIGFICVHLLFNKSIHSKLKMYSGLLVLLFLVSLVSHYVNPKKIFSIPVKNHFYYADDNLYDREQIKKIFNTQNECGSIVYLNQTPMWVYSAYGALKCGAIVTYVWPTPNAELTNIINNRQDLSHAVATHPVYDKVGVPILNQNRMLSLLLNPSPSDTVFKVRLRTHLNDADVSFTLRDKNNVILDSRIESLPKRNRKEFLFKNTDLAILEIKVSSGDVLIEKASFSDALHWPWEPGRVLNFYNLDASGAVLNRTEINLYQWQTDLLGYYGLKAKTIDDSKSTVLMTAELK